ncbi:hypothetical protein GCK72_007554 [Caenorhabditis remanei]|uniref:BTB domain-containing protein n=1 Tax=Caenorhabditis remanei TaxID=31234 RepID=A0A6A5HJD6_CAERE|nr:hypothetical protein GCK72_007554 [Caenorhabditis remanei]KAF1767595.1 hypothetical protein GCK72_007554 [Caenorhabditis remanei]
MSSPIQLDVGGTIFKTSKSTLTRFDGFFKTMLETNVPVEQNKSGHIFIDRDPTHFRLILNFMRDGDVKLPDSKQDLDEISREANFYLLKGLMELCSRKWEVPEPKKVSKMRFLESDDDVLRAIAYPEKAVLIFYYTVDRRGRVIKLWDSDNQRYFDIFELLKKYEKEFDIYFRKRPPGDEDWLFCIYYKNQIIVQENFSKSFRNFDTEIQNCIGEIECLKSSDDY